MPMRQEAAVFRAEQQVWPGGSRRLLKSQGAVAMLFFGGHGNMVCRREADRMSSRG